MGLGSKGASCSAGARAGRDGQAACRGVALSSRTPRRTVCQGACRLCRQRHERGGLRRSGGRVRSRGGCWGGPGCRAPPLAGRPGRRPGNRAGRPQRLGQGVKPGGRTGARQGPAPDPRPWEEWIAHVCAGRGGGEGGVLRRGLALHAEGAGTHAGVAATDLFLPLGTRSKGPVSAAVDVWPASGCPRQLCWAGTEPRLTPLPWPCKTARAGQRPGQTCHRCRPAATGASRKKAWTAGAAAAA